MFLKNKIVLLIVFSLTLILLFLYKNYNNKSDIQIGGDFELTNHLGQKVTNKSFNDYSYNLSGSCMQICPCQVPLPSFKYQPDCIKSSSTHL